MMAAQDELPGTPSLDEWISEIGEQGVAAVVRAAVTDIEEGATPGFVDKQALLEYIGRRASA